MTVDESKIKILFGIHAKHEAAEKFSLDELLTFTREDNLPEWFSLNFYSFEARKLTAALKGNANAAQLKVLLCKIFELSPENLSAEELAEISATVDKNHRRELFMKKNPDDDRKHEFVETQGELVEALREGAQVIYLCGGEFRIPLDRRATTYIGCENAVVDLDEEDFIDLDANEIVLENLQVCLRHSTGLRAEKSKNLKVLDCSKKTLATNLQLKEIFDILRGRRAFESPAAFKRRAEKILGAAVGLVLLDEKDFDFDNAQFNFRPRWDVEYIAVLKDFVRGRNFFVKLSPKDAATLYANERKLQIFADFTRRDGRLTILNLYLETKTLGRVMIESFLCAEKISSVSSGADGLGYGLDIITAYDVRFEHESISHAANAQ